MKKIIYILLFAASLLFLPLMTAHSQTRVAVLPFQNMDGRIEFNLQCYSLQQELFKALSEADPEGKNFHLIPADSVEQILADLNVDPTNPQYPSDLWKAVATLNVQKVITGNFNIQAKRFLINAYIYSVDTKLADPVHQARDIFKKKEALSEAIPMILKAIKPALIKE
jgi:hypothetical protein